MNRFSLGYLNMVGLDFFTGMGIIKTVFRFLVLVSSETPALSCSWALNQIPVKMVRGPPRLCVCWVGRVMNYDYIMSAPNAQVGMLVRGLRWDDPRRVLRSCGSHVAVRMGKRRMVARAIGRERK